MIPRVGFVLAVSGLVVASLGVPAQAAVWDSDGGVVHWGDRDATAVSMASLASTAMRGKSIVELEGGGSFTCARSAKGQAFCWGLGQEGSLGNGGEGLRLQPTPVRVSGALRTAGFDDLDAGMRHICGLSNGKAYCWGIAMMGRLGNGKGAGNVLKPAPVDASGALSGKTIVDIAAGTAHTCALDDQGRAYCWGYNDYGQVGDGSRTDRKTPVAVSRAGVLDGVQLVAIDTGGGQTCAVDSSGQVYCWGRNADGELGIGSTDSRRVVPARVDMSGALLGESVRRLALGSDHSCALDADGHVYCWGLGQRGRLGTGESRTSRVPVAVDRSGALRRKQVVSIDSVWNHTCASSTNATFCWGGNVDGQVGSSAGDVAVSPVRVGEQSSASGAFTRVATGSSHSCAVDADSLVFCWGRGSDGQLGTGDTRARPIASRVSTDAAMDEVRLTRGLAAGADHACGVSAGGQMFCWGGNRLGQLGNGESGVALSVPVPVDGDGYIEGLFVELMSAGDGFTCAWGGTNDIFCWGRGSDGQLGDGASTSSITPVSVDASGVLATAVLADLDSGTAHSCAIDQDGKAYCWGRGASGQLGDGSSTGSATPVLVDDSALADGEVFAEVSAGGDTTCGRTTLARAFCWGNGASGQLGAGDTSSSAVPQLIDMTGVLSEVNIQTLDVGPTHVCAVTTSDDPVCWGSGSQGQLGDGQKQMSSVPVAVELGGIEVTTRFVDITAGDRFTCAVSDDFDRLTFCWGDNRYGQLGDGTTTDALTPVLTTQTGPLAQVTATDVEASTSGVWSLTSP